MKNKFYYKGSILFILLIFNSCSTLLNIPSNSQQSTLGEVTHYTSAIKNLPVPKEKVVVGVYKFRDQTGQYKPSENGSNWSTAIPQGTTTILIKALEDSRWFMPIERENIGNLLNERQIIRSTRKEYMPNQSNENGNLPPLLYAGIILEGGVISYDTNVVTGGLGARYFGIGASKQYRQDRITVYIRAVSTQTGEILKTVYTSKTILSTSVSGNFFKYVDTERLLEAEIGYTQNEPVQLAVTEAIEKAVYSLIVEGVRDNIWGKEMVANDAYKPIIAQYDLEQNETNTKDLGKTFLEVQRPKFSIFGMAEASKLKGDYPNSKVYLGVKGGGKYFISDHFNLELNASYLHFEHMSKKFYRRAISADANVEYMLFPKSKFTPFLYGGVGSLNYSDKNFFKAQAGGGLEYLFKNNLAVRLSGQYDFGFNDDWDLLVSGKREDQSMRLAVGLSYYFNFKKIKK